MFITGNFIQYAINTSFALSFEYSQWKQALDSGILWIRRGFMNMTLGVHEYRQVSNIRRTLVGNEIVDHSDVVGASPVGAAPTTSSWST